MTYYYDRYWGLFYYKSYRVGDTAHILDGQSILVGPGYSGHFPHINSPGAQNVQNAGPVPVGRYTLVGPVTKNIEGKTIGPNSYHLTPDPKTKMYGRSGMMIHGDNEEEAHSASDGCIVTPFWVRYKLQDGDVLIVV